MDDEPLIRDWGQKMPSMMGYTALTASNGKQALEIYKEHNNEIASVVIFDVVMTGRGGINASENSSVSIPLPKC